MTSATMSSAETTAVSPFVCPRCDAPLRAREPSGALDCARCNASYPVVSGVPRFVSSEHYASSFGTEWTTFRSTQLDSSNGTHISQARFRQLSPVPLEELRGKRVLEIGCGMGRFLEVVAGAGAHAFGIDLSRAVEAASENLSGRFPNVTIAQADLFALPFPAASFDFIYTFGVIHHTPSPRDAVRALARALKPGGRLTVWVYGRRGPGWIPRPYQVYTRLFSRVPEDKLVPALKHYARAALALGRMPGAGRAFRQLFPVQDLELKGPGQDGYEDGSPRQLPRDFVLEWAWLNAFDMFTPRFSTQHDFSDAEEWFRSAGLVDVVRSNVRVALTGTKPDIPAAQA